MGNWSSKAKRKKKNKDKIFDMKLTIFIGVLLLSFQAFSQNFSSTEYQKALGKITNKRAVFSVTNPVRITDSTGKVIASRRIVELEDGYLKKVAKKYGKELIPYLVKMFDDSDRDWAANVLLYALTESSAATLRYYDIYKIDNWRRLQKQSDKEKWQKYLEIN